MLIPIGSAYVFLAATVIDAWSSYQILVLPFAASQHPVEFRRRSTANSGQQSDSNFNHELVCPQGMLGGYGGTDTSDVVVKTATHCARSISVDAIEKKSTSNGLWRFSFFLLDKSTKIQHCRQAAPAAKTTESKNKSTKPANGEPGRHPA